MSSKLTTAFSKSSHFPLSLDLAWLLPSPCRNIWGGKPTLGCENYPLTISNTQAKSHEVCGSRAHLILYMQGSVIHSQCFGVGADPLRTAACSRRTNPLPYFGRKRQDLGNSVETPQGRRGVHAPSDTFLLSICKYIISFWSMVSSFCRSDYQQIAKELPQLCP